MEKNQEQPRFSEADENKRRLLEQFNQPVKLDAGGPGDEIFDVGPEDVKVPVFYSQGFVSNPKTNRGNILALADGGERVLAVSTYHGINAEPDGKHPEIQLRKVEAILQALKQKNIAKADAVGYSEGTVNVLLAAYLHPEKFRNIVLVEPIGMIGKDSYFQINLRYFASALAALRPVKELEKREKKQIANYRDSSKLKLKYYFIPQSYKHVINTVRAISKTNAVELLNEVRSKGIKVSIIHSADSHLVPSDRLQEQLMQGSVDGFYELPGTHGSYNSYPETYTKAVHHALINMSTEQNPTTPDLH